MRWWLWVTMSAEIVTFAITSGWSGHNCCPCRTTTSVLEQVLCEALLFSGRKGGHVLGGRTTIRPAAPAE